MRTLKLSNKRTEWNKRGCIIINKFPPCSSKNEKKYEQEEAQSQKLIIEAARLLGSWEWKLDELIDKAC